jgi:hypothetical protein
MATTLPGRVKIAASKIAGLEPVMNPSVDTTATPNA